MVHYITHMILSHLYNMYKYFKMSVTRDLVAVSSKRRQFSLYFGIFMQFVNLFWHNPSVL